MTNGSIKSTIPTFLPTQLQFSTFLSPRMRTSTLLNTTFQTGRGRRITLKLGFRNWLTALLLLLSPAVMAQLSGTYTINSAQPTGGTNFASFTAAATALNTSGISGPVRFNVLNGPYIEQFALGVIAGVSATDTIVVDGGASKQTLSYSGVVSQPAAVQLNGTDYVTLSNLTIDASAGVTYGIGVHLVGQADNNRISNCVVRGPATATSSTANAGIAASGTVTSATSVGNANSVRIENNVISGGYYGVVLTGTSTSARTSGNRVINNEIRDFYIYGLDVENSTGPRLTGNNIHRTSRTTVSSFYGVYLLGCVNTAIERNRIHDTFTGNTASTSAAYGLYFTSADATAGNENDVVNNLIYSFNGSGTEYGVYNGGSDFVRYYHNTVSLDNQAATGATQTTYGIYQVTAATGIDVRNNIVSVTRSGGTGSKYALAFATTTSTITSNYNDLFVGTGATYFTGRFGTADYATLANWRTANTNAYDQNSIDAAPQFVNLATNDLRPSASPLNNSATPLARVTTDFTGAPRSTTPDMGAYEFAPAADDVAVVSIDSPTSPASTGAGTVTVTVLNNGATPLNSVRLTYVLNGGTAVAQTFTLTGGVASGATRAVSFTTQATLIAGANTLTVTASLPNGNTDTNAANNTQTVTLYTALAGTYTINNTQPTGGTNFASFTDAATALNQGGVLTPVTFNVSGGPYTEQISLSTIAGASATNRVVFNGNGRTIQFGSSATGNGPLLRLMVPTM